MELGSEEVSAVLVHLVYYYEHALAIVRCKQDVFLSEDNFGEALE